MINNLIYNELLIYIESISISSLIYGDCIITITMIIEHLA